MILKNVSFINVGDIDQSSKEIIKLGVFEDKAIVLQMAWHYSFAELFPESEYNNEETICSKTEQHLLLSEKSSIEKTTVSIELKRPTVLWASILSVELMHEDNQKKSEFVRNPVPQQS